MIRIRQVLLLLALAGLGSSWAWAAAPPVVIPYGAVPRTARTQAAARAAAWPDWASGPLVNPAALSEWPPAEQPLEPELEGRPFSEGPWEESVQSPWNPEPAEGNWQWSPTRPRFSGAACDSAAPWSDQTCPDGTCDFPAIPYMPYADGPHHPWTDQPWSWQVLPDGLIYQPYLAGSKEPRLGTTWFYDDNQGWLWDTTLGGRVGLLRLGSTDCYRPEGWQVDVDGAAFLRLDPEEDRDLVSADFRAGVSATYAIGILEARLGYYHLSSHLGDEFMLRNPAFRRINYVRDVIYVGTGLYLTDDLRIYSELGYAVYTGGGAEPWELQLGFDYAPAQPTGLRGAPFAAANLFLREEVSWGGNLTLQAGWMWRGQQSRHLLRLGAHYLVGKSPQFEFFTQNEQQIGVGLWYDF